MKDIKDLMKKVIPHFLKYPLISSKSRDFKKFTLICEMIYIGKHYNKSGLSTILNLSYEMNGLGARRYSKQELLSFIK